MKIGNFKIVKIKICANIAINLILVTTASFVGIVNYFKISKN